MRRRQFIVGLGSVAGWPLVARAQQAKRMRRIGVLMTLPADDPETLQRMAAFKQGLQELGWTEGRNVQFDFRSGSANADLYRRYAAELVALVPDVLLANGGVTFAMMCAPTSSLSRSCPAIRWSLRQSMRYHQMIFPDSLDG
jgi:putative ABC transport system substrate-binding protein